MTVPIIGIDEVGRGCLAGPLCIAAVLLYEPVLGLRDSKKLSPKRRQQLALEIKQKGVVGLGWVAASEIDRIGMGQALRLAAERATEDLPNELPASAEIIIDGTINLLPKLRSSTLIKADDTIQEVMAASIVAKVARDSFMDTYSHVFPEYDFAANKGYGTARHMRALQKHGGTPLHRFSFAPLAVSTAPPKATSPAKPFSKR